MAGHARHLRDTRLGYMAVVAVFALVGTAAGIASAAIPDPDGTIHACYRHTRERRGAIRIIDPAARSCSSSETPIAWHNDTTVATHDHVGQTWNVAGGGLLMYRTGLAAGTSQQLRLLPIGSPTTGARYSSSGLTGDIGYRATIDDAEFPLGMSAFIDNSESPTGLAGFVEDSSGSTAVQGTIKRDDTFGVGVRGFIEDSFGTAVVGVATGENGSAIFGATEADETTFETALGLVSGGATLISASTDDGENDSVHRFGVDGLGNVFADGDLVAETLASVVPDDGNLIEAGTTQSNDYTRRFTVNNIGDVFASAFVGTVPEGDQDLLQLLTTNGVDPDDTRFRVDNDGNVTADGTYSSPAADLAERVKVLGTVRAGEVIEIDPASTDTFRRSESAYSPLVAGVVSTRPGVILGDGPIKHPVVALAGRVPVLATDEGGDIQPGDLIVASSTPGRAMRCDRTDRCTGSVIGKALGPLSAPTGTLTMLVVLS